MNSDPQGKTCWDMRVCYLVGGRLVPVLVPQYHPVGNEILSARDETTEWATRETVCLDSGGGETVR